MIEFIISSTPLSRCQTIHRYITHLLHLPAQYLYSTTARMASLLAFIKDYLWRQSSLAATLETISSKRASNPNLIERRIQHHSHSRFSIAVPAPLTPSQHSRSRATAVSASPPSQHHRRLSTHHRPCIVDAVRHHRLPSSSTPGAVPAQPSQHRRRSSITLLQHCRPRTTAVPASLPFQYHCRPSLSTTAIPIPEPPPFRSQ